MKYVIDHDLHIHSYLSSCSSDPKQSPEFILGYAKENGFSTVCITDHYWDSATGGFISDGYSKQNFDHISSILPLPKDGEVEMLFGCETDIRADLTLGTLPERYPEFDFMVIPTTHLHMKGFTISEEDIFIPERCAELWASRLDALLDMSLPFEKVGIAHLTCYLTNKSSKENFLETMRLIQNERMHYLFEKAAKVGAGVELNLSDISLTKKYPDVLMPIYKAAKDAGCKFYLGSDSHHPSEFKNAKKYFEAMAEALALTEDDKIPFIRDRKG